jgi:hypothetical protein
MSGIQPVTKPDPPKAINTCVWLWCEGAVLSRRGCAISAALAPSSCNQGRGRCAHQLSERAQASSPWLNINHKPLKSRNCVVVESCKRWPSCPVGLQGKWRRCVGPWHRHAGATPNMYSILPHKQNIVPPNRPRLLL